MIALLWTSLALAATPPVVVRDGSVLLSWPEFEALYKASQAPVQPPVVVPQAYTLDHATYSGKVVGEGEEAYALLHLSLRGQVHEGRLWTSVPVLSSAAALQRATSGGKDAPIALVDGWYTLVTNRPGPFSAELDFAVPLTTMDGETGFSLPLTPAGAAELSFSVDSKEPLELELGQGRILSQSTAGAQRQLSAVLPGNGSLALSWQREIKDEAEAAGRVYAETQSLVGVAEGVLQGRSVVQYTILHQPVQSLRLHLPGDATVLEVAGPGIREWTQGKDGTIQVQLNYEAIGSYRLTVDYERPAAPGAPLRLPLPRVLDVSREKSWVGLDARTAVEVVASPANNAVPVDVRELPPAILGQTDHPVLFGWKARGGEVEIPIEIRAHADVQMLVTLVDQARADTLVTVDGRQMTRVVYAVRNNRRQFLRVKLPEGAEVWSASVAGRAVKLAQGDGGILVPLVRSDAGGGAMSAFSVELVYVTNEPALEKRGRLSADLPVVDVPTSQLQWQLWVPESVKVKKRSDEGSVRHVQSFSAAPRMPSDAVVTANQRAQVQQRATAQAEAGAMGQGVEPVEVELPLTGNVRRYEKTLVLNEALNVSVEYKRKD